MTSNLHRYKPLREELKGVVTSRLKISFQESKQTRDSLRGAELHQAELTKGYHLDIVDKELLQTVKKKDRNHNTKMSR